MLYHSLLVVEIRTDFNVVGCSQPAGAEQGLYLEPARRDAGRRRMDRDQPDGSDGAAATAQPPGQARRRRLPA